MNGLDQRWWCVLWFLIPVALFAQDESSPQKPRSDAFSERRLEQLRQRFPEADSDRDGRLTNQEAREYRAKRDRSGGVDQAAGEARIAPTEADVAYGSHARQVLDLYRAQSSEPTPLVVYIHGGGFVGGDKKSIRPGMVRAANAAGISVASLHYRFVDGEDVIFPAPQLDCARALQYLRSRAAEWNLDPRRVACYGGSAGAGISMWLGFHDDLADPTSEDPIARQSTRLTAVGTMGGQSTYDPIKIKALVGGRAWEHPSLFKVYGVETAAEALRPSPEMQKLYDEASAITHLTEDDAPLFMIYSEPDIVPPADTQPGEFIHHPNFGKHLKEAMDELGIEAVYVHTSDAPGRDLQREMLEFFEKHFAKAR